MEFYAHQKEVIAEKDRADRLRFGNWRGTGSGKTKTLVAIAEGRTLVVCLKQQKADRIFEKEWIEQGRDPSLLFVVTLDEFKKAVVERRMLDLTGGVYPDTLGIDEAHKFAGISADERQKDYQKFPKTSDVYLAMIYYIRQANPKRVVPMTATPIPHPMALFGLSEFLGMGWDYHSFRNTFYYEAKIRGTNRWLPKFRRKAWKNATPNAKAFIERERAESTRLIEIAKKRIGYTGKLDDWFDVPAQTFRTVRVGTTAAQEAKYKLLKTLYPDPLVFAGKRQRLEQGIFDHTSLAEDGVTVVTHVEFVDENKSEHIESLMQEFGKVVVFCRYNAQIELYQKKFEEDYRVLVLNGATKNRGDVMAAANDGEDCLLLANCAVSAGWEVPEYPCVVFASKNYSYVDYVQALGRVQRANAIKKNLYVSLVAGDGDEAVNAIVEQKEDFAEADNLKILCESKKLLSPRA